MSKESGLGDNLYVNGVNISGDTGSISGLTSPVATLPSTGIDKSAAERLAALRSGEINYSAHWNPEGAHPVLSSLPGQNVLVSYNRGTELGSPAAGLQALQVNYDPTRGADGAFSVAVQALSTDSPTEWGRQLTPGVRQDVAATNGPSVDFGAQTLFGLSAYLHVFSFTGTSADIVIEDSADGAIFAPLLNGAFGTVTAAPEGQRLETNGDQTVRQHLRVATSGTFSELSFAVLVIKHEAEVLPW